MAVLAGMRERRQNLRTKQRSIDRWMEGLQLFISDRVTISDKATFIFKLYRFTKYLCLGCAVVNKYLWKKQVDNETWQFLTVHLLFPIKFFVKNCHISLSTCFFPSSFLTWEKAGGQQNVTVFNKYLMGKSMDNEMWQFLTNTWWEKAWTTKCDSF